MRLFQVFFIHPRPVLKSLILTTMPTRKFKWLFNYETKIFFTLHHQSKWTLTQFRDMTALNSFKILLNFRHHSRNWKTYKYLPMFHHVTYNYIVVCQVKLVIPITHRVHTLQLCQIQTHSLSSSSFQIHRFDKMTLDTTSPCHYLYSSFCSRDHYSR